MEVSGLSTKDLVEQGTAGAGSVLGNWAAEAELSIGEGFVLHQAWENIWNLHPVVNHAVQVKQKQK